jgi:hypothetical protein
MAGIKKSPPRRRVRLEAANIKWAHSMAFSGAVGPRGDAYVGLPEDVCHVLKRGAALGGARKASASCNALNKAVRSLGSIRSPPALLRLSSGSAPRMNRGRR